jgi:osmoprotectant transport system permease protein
VESGEVGLMDIAAIAAWFGDPANWSGTNGIPNRLLEHVLISAASLVAATAIALPLGLAIGHTRRGEVLAVGVANIGRALPSLALLIGLIPILGLGAGTTLVALALLGIPPIVTNAYVGIREVDPDVVESGRAMGMSQFAVLRRVEVPIALPVILAGIRLSAVQIVATATLWALVAGGGLGRYIIDGFAVRDVPRIVAGAILVALLAVATEVTFAAVARALVSPGIRRTPTPTLVETEMRASSPALDPGA